MQDKDLTRDDSIETGLLSKPASQQASKPASQQASKPASQQAVQLTLFDYLHRHQDRYVRQIDYQEAKWMILHIHYARRMPCITNAYGLFADNKLIGVVTFGQPASPSLCNGLAGKKNRKNVLELNRLVILPGHEGNNNASYLVSRALKMLPHHTFVVSYADWGGWGHVGYVYQATNFLYTGITKARTDKYSEGHSRHYAKDEKRRKPRSAKHRYVFLVGNRKERKEMRRQLNYHIIDNYPKGTSRHYDTDNPISILEENHTK